MEFWISIEDTLGNVYGVIRTATNWQSSPKLDSAGSFSFEMPASDPKSLLIENKRVARCQGILDGTLTDMGMGIIDSAERVVGNPSMLMVSGPDIMAELANITVGDFAIKEDKWTFLDDPNYGTLHLIEVRSHVYPYVYYTSDPVDAHNGDIFDVGTVITLQSPRSGFPEDAKYLYVGYDSRFSKIRMTFSSFTTLDGLSFKDALRIQYYSSLINGWVTLPGVIDNTVVPGEGTWRQNGTIEFVPPRDWVRYDEAVGGAGNWFWIRMQAATNAPDDPRHFTATVAEVEVFAEFPTLDGPQMLMDAFGPFGWTIIWDGMGDVQTVWEKYLLYEGESLLTAFLMLAEQGGQDAGQAIREHFRLEGFRTLKWLGIAKTASGLRATRSFGDAVIAEVVPIYSLTQKDDTSEVFNRIFAISRDYIGIENADRVAPAGYSTGSTIFEELEWHYVQHDASVAQYGPIERWTQFSDIEAQQSQTITTHTVYTANAVFDKAVEALRTHAELAKHYSLSVVRYPKLIMCGETIECVYKEYRDGVLVVDIDTYALGDPLWIISPTLSIENSGVSVINLEVSTVDREEKSDAAIVVDLVRRRNTSGSLGAVGLVTGGTSVTLTPGADIRISGHQVSRAGTGVLLFSEDGSLLAEYGRGEIQVALDAAAEGDRVELPTMQSVEALTVPRGRVLRGNGVASILTGPLTVVGTLESVRIVRTGSEAVLAAIEAPAEGDTGILRNVVVEVMNTGGEAYGLRVRAGGNVYAYETEIVVSGTPGYAALVESGTFIHYSGRAVGSTPYYPYLVAEV